MLYLIAVVLGILLGVAAKGKISNLLKVKFEKIWIIVLAFAIQTVLRVLTVNRLDIALKYGLVIQCIVFGILLIGFWLNRRYLGMSLIGLGCMLNAFTMALNGGRMPVSIDALTKANMGKMLKVLQIGTDGKHMIADKTTKLFFLSDVINLPPFLGAMMPIVSIGDLIIAVGVFALVLFIVADKRFHYDKF